MRFQCPSCKKIVAAPDGQFGKKMNCPNCNCPVVTPESAFGAGIVIGDFIIIKQLGAGGAGVVFLAHQISLDRPAALKIIKEASPDSSDDPVNDLIREARSAAKLNHPNIVQAYAVGEDDGVFYFAMEYVEGETMKSVLKHDGALDPKKAAKIIQQIAEGLQFAWDKQKLTHRDIKPDNIMLTSSGQAKLADLGLSRRAGEHSEEDDSDEVMGTPQYISPEQLTGATVDTRSDIYSLGATFYQFVTGRFPYEGPDVDEIAKQHVIGNLTPPKSVNHNVPDAVNSIIMKMMARYPEQRYQSPGEVAKAIEAYLHPTTAGTPAAGRLGLGGGLNAASGSTAESTGGGLRAGGMKVLAPSGSAESLKGAFHKPELHKPENEIPHTIGIGVPTSLEEALPGNTKSSKMKVNHNTTPSGVPPQAAGGMPVAQKKSNSITVMAVIVLVVMLAIGAFAFMKSNDKKSNAAPRKTAPAATAVAKSGDVAAEPDETEEPVEAPVTVAGILEAPAPIDGGFENEMKGKYINFALAVRDAAAGNDVNKFKAVATALDDERAAISKRPAAEQRMLSAMLDGWYGILVLHSGGMKIQNALLNGSDLAGMRFELHGRVYVVDRAENMNLIIYPAGEEQNKSTFDPARLAGTAKVRFFEQLGKKLNVKDAFYCYCLYNGDFPALNGVSADAISRNQLQDFERAYFLGKLKYGSEQDKSDLDARYHNYESFVWASRNL